MRPALSRQGVFGATLLAATGIALGAMAAAPFLWSIGAQQALADARLELAFLESKLKPDGRAKPEGFTAADDVTPLYIGGATPGLALADFQRRIERAATEAGMDLIRSQPLQVEATPGQAALRMDIDVAGNLENLRGLLHTIETGEPFMFVTSAKIAPARSGDGGLPSDNLTASLQLEAFGWQEAAP